MDFDTITVTPVSPHIGAEVSGIDLQQPLTNRQVKEVYQALLEYLVIFFHDQDMDFEAHRRFTGYFGDLHVHVGGKGTASRMVEGFPEIRHQHFDETSKRVSGETWHTDQSCAEIPPMASVLQQRIVPPNGGGDTLFASMYAAYDALSNTMQGFLEGLTATHDGAIMFDRTDVVYPKAVHPVITTHPDTGKKLIYVNPGFTTHINELSRPESDALLGFLFEHCAKPDFQYRFRWRTNSIAFWDNRPSQHQAIWDYYPEIRSGYRIQITGKEGPKPV